MRPWAAGKKFVDSAVFPLVARIGREYTSYGGGMDVPIANCKRCGRIFNKVRRDLCPACVEEEEAAFLRVRDYLRQNKNATIGDVVENTGVPSEKIVQMIQDGRLLLRDNPNLVYPCERCGEMTQTGRLCARCTQEMAKELGESTKNMRRNAEGKKDAEKKGFYSR